MCVCMYMYISILVYTYGICIYIYMLEFKANVRCNPRAFRYSLGRISGLRLQVKTHPLLQFAMEHVPFIDDLSIENDDFPGNC